jgi:EpsI family protein
MNRILRHFAFLLILALTVWAANRLERPASRPLEHPLAGIPLEFDGWSGVDDPALDADVSAQLNASDYLLRTYRNGGRTAGLFVAYYSHQLAGAGIHPPKDCLPGNGWNIVDTRYSNAGSEWKTGSLYYIQKGDERRLGSYWYQSGSRVMATELGAKVRLLSQAIKGDTSGAVGRVIVPDSPEALRAGQRFAAAAMDAITDAQPR